MPVYEYRCRACGHQFEIQQSFSDEPLTECPACGGDLRKVFTPVGITFKGSGFYKTDSRSTSRSGSSDSGGPDGGGASSGSGSESSSGTSSGTSSGSTAAGSGGSAD